MKKAIKIFVYICGIILIVGIGLVSEISDGNYPMLEKELHSSAQQDK